MPHPPNQSFCPSGSSPSRQIHPYIALRMQRQPQLREIHPSRSIGGAIQASQQRRCGLDGGSCSCWKLDDIFVVKIGVTEALEKMEVGWLVGYSVGKRWYSAVFSASLRPAHETWEFSFDITCDSPNLHRHLPQVRPVDHIGGTCRAPPFDRKWFNSCQSSNKIETLLTAVTMNVRLAWIRKSNLIFPSWNPQREFTNFLDGFCSISSSGKILPGFPSQRSTGSQENKPFKLCMPGTWTTWNFEMDDLWIISIFSSSFLINVSHQFGALAIQSMHLEIPLQFNELPLKSFSFDDEIPFAHGLIRICCELLRRRRPAKLDWLKLGIHKPKYVWKVSPDSGE